MSSTGHIHRIEPIAWSTAGRPAVLFGCTTGICAKTEAVSPTARARKIPDFITEDQFAALKDGKYWPEIVNV